VFELHGLPGPTAASPLWQDQKDESGGKQQTTISDVFLCTFSAEACIQESSVLLLICFCKRVRATAACILVITFHNRFNDRFPGECGLTGSVVLLRFLPPLVLEENI